jgi:hypothetical protein
VRTGRRLSKIAHAGVDGAGMSSGGGSELLIGLHDVRCRPPAAGSRPRDTRPKLRAFENARAPGPSKCDAAGLVDWAAPVSVVP